ncbi:MAG: hypothetical protein IKN41_08475, partial [Candidatus Methanomethylophilaceae archaeon]|nr:hypothetical protein [Candidatus Methanomethylophilaceae archaeon]
PTKESTASHTYSFSKWVVRGTQQDIPANITQDWEFEAKYDENDRTYHITLPSSGTYTIAPKQGSSLDTVYGHDFTFVFTTEYEITKFDFYIDGTSIPRPTSVGEGQYEYTVSNIVKDILISVTDNTSSQYDVVWKNSDGSTLYKQKVGHNEISAYPGASNPTKQPDKDSVFAFKGWLPAAGQAVTSDMEFVAQYTSSPRYYDVTFQTSSGEFTVHTEQSTHVKYNDTFVFQVELAVSHSKFIDELKAVPVVGGVSGEPIDPISVEGRTATFSYKVTDDVRFTFPGIKINTYTVTWIYKTGPSTEVQTTSTNVHGIAPQAPTSIPASFSNPQYTWTLSGWSPSLHPITSDGEEFTAQYTPTVNKYSLTVPSSTPQFTITLEKVTAQGSEPVNLSENDTWDYGTEFIITVDLDSKFNQSTVGFLKNGVPISEPTVGSKTDHFTILGNTEIGLNANISINFYDVKWYNGSTLLQTEHVQYGYTTTYPGSSNPTKESTASHTYSFSKWVVRGTQQDIPANITQDWEFEAKYTENDRYYDVTFQTSSGEFTIHTEQSTHVKYNDTFVFQVELGVTHSKSIENIKAVPVIGGTPGASINPTSKVGNTATFSCTITDDVRFNFSGVSINTYTVKWNYKTGPSTDVQTTTTVVHGVPSQAPTTVPVSFSNTQYTWTLSGWSSAMHPITSDGEEFTAQYNVTVNKYNVNVLSTTPQLIIGLKKVVGTELIDITDRNFKDDYGATYRVYATFTERYTQSTLSMTKNGVTMSPFEPGVYEFTIEGDTAIDFNGQIKMNTYTVTWIINEDDTKVDTVAYGTVPDADSIIPSWPSTQQYHYEFDKWESNITGVTVTTPVTQDVTYTAQYNPVLNKYEV